MNGESDSDRWNGSNPDLHSSCVGRMAQCAQPKLIGDRLGRHLCSFIFAAARWLLQNRRAEPSDTVATYRGEMPCMSGKASVRKIKASNAESVPPVPT
jgi:hypothetical protein